MKKLGLIGYPLGHSFSKKYFTEKFTSQNLIDFEYELYPIKEISEITKLITSIPELIGLNVTIPYKEAVIPFLDEIDETAKIIGAVNTICIIRTKEKAHLTGYNTDAFGFNLSIKPFLESKHDRALILGTGGASKAVAFVLKKLNIPFLFVSRQNETNSTTVTYGSLNKEMIQHHRFIINTTPVGTFPNTGICPDIPYDAITPDHFCCDLIYNPTETLFLSKAKNKGAITLNGLSMLHLQAEKAWEIWNKSNMH